MAARGPKGRAWVYGLVEPGTHLVRYVGQTRRSPTRRWREHLGDPRTHGPLVRRWIQGLSERPSLVVLQVTTRRRASAVERAWCRRLWPQLLNARLGGQPSRTEWRKGLRRPGVAAANRRRRGLPHVRLDRCVPVLCVETTMVYPSLQAAAEAHATSRGNVWRVLRGDLESVRGASFEEVDLAMVAGPRRGPKRAEERTTWRRRSRRRSS